MGDARSPSAKASSQADVAEELGVLLRDEKEGILTEWRRRVLADPEVPSANELSRPQLRDHIPALIDWISDQLQKGGEASDRVSYTSRAHAGQRFDQGYSVDAVLRELSHLRGVIIQFSARSHPELTEPTVRLINLSIDEVMADVASDIAERERRGRERADEILERGLPLLVLDANWKIVFTNPGQERASQMSGSQVRGRSVWEVFPTLNRPDLQFFAQYHRAMDERVPVTFEEFYPPLELWTEQNVFPVRDDGIAIFFSNINERKRDERLRRLLTEISGLLAQSLDYGKTLHTFADLVVQHLADYCMIDLVEEDGRFHRLAIAAADPLKLELMRQAEQFPPSAAPDSPFQRVLVSREPILVPRVTSEWLDALADHPTYRRILGDLAPTSAMLVPLVVRDRSIGVLKILSAGASHRFDDRDLEFASDLGQRAAFAIDNARLFQQVRTDADNLAAEAAVRERFIAILTHDIRSPLSAVHLTSASMLIDEGLPDRFVRGTQRIVRSTERIERMVANLLDLTRVRHLGGIHIAPEPFDLAMLVRDVVDEVQVIHSDRLIEVESRGDCDGNWDRGRIAQVVNNLITNALKYSPPETSVKIAVRGEKEHVWCSVQNQGAPIAADRLATIFAPFKRAESQPGATGAGLGLGLYIASEIVRAHGGTLSVESNATEGTTFTVTLPRRPA